MARPILEGERVFGRELMDLLEQVILRSGGIFMTLGRQPRRNRVTGLAKDGIEVETEASVGKEAGPQTIPAWMFVRAWKHLQLTGELSNKFLLSSDGLNVKRSSAVCAILAKLPGVRIRRGNKIVLEVG